MNSMLSPKAMEACLEVLYRGLVEIRMASLGNDSVRAEAIADALHNLPHLLSDGDRRGWTIAKFREFFLADLVHRFPDLVGLDETLRAVE
jgi:hypothetical protein